MVVDTDQPFEPTELQPLGIFAIMGLHDHPLRAVPLIRSLVGRLDATEATQVTSYLRHASMVLPIMGYSNDVLADAFAVAGGLAIVTDGRFFWRYDTADYVEHYRVALPDDFVDFGRSLGWNNIELAKQAEREADVYLSDYYRSGLDNTLWPDEEHTP